MKTGTRGIALIKEFEGLQLTAYYDPVGVLTIGYGHTNNTASASKYPVSPGMTITAAKAEQILKEDLISYETSVNNLVKTTITQNQFDALVSFTYNLGAGTLANSDLLVMVNGRDFIGASKQFGLYVHGGGVVLPGLVRRRREEANLFMEDSPESSKNIDITNRAINAMIKWMEDRKGKVTYSMANRNGPDSYDCSSAVYHALAAGGFLKAGSNGNTDTLFNDLERNGWVQVPVVNGQIKTQRGDIFIWGIRGNSTGAFGHTGIFYDDNDNIIHCNAGYNGITVNNHDTIWYANGSPANTIYRYDGNQFIEPNTEPDKKGTLTPHQGVFYPNMKLPVSSDATEASPALDYYQKGDAIVYDGYLFNDGYVWISYISGSGKRRYVAIGPDDGRTDTVWGLGFFDNAPNNAGDKGSLISFTGTFIPSTKLPVCSEPTEASPALDYYTAGMKIYYDSYIFTDGYAWISYLTASGKRRYVAVGPDDGNPDTVWGTGFLNDVPVKSTTGNLIPMVGVFTPNTKLPVCSEPTEASPALDYYSAGMPIIYDSYIFTDGYAWISYLTLAFSRRYIAVGPDDGRTDTVWGTGFFSNQSNSTQQTATPPTLIAHKGTFTPNTKLPVCAEPTEASPALDYYSSGMNIYYDSYIFEDGYAWISYLTSSGKRRYVAVGPDDGNSNTVWGKGFFN
ncbi:SH3 domain-containing protein [[Clostridium] innocuum]|nr:SH3 domain-containing protein [[Clostridium] innocuum]MCR0561260.1 SH3 domain-containing protein [[Clostridium] innocuum]